MASVNLHRGKPASSGSSARTEAGGTPRHPTTALRPAARRALSIPIALKFAVFIAILVVVFMAWQTSTAMRVAVESQDAAINDSGVKDVCALASSLDPLWMSDLQQVGKLKQALQSYCAATRQLGVLNAVVYPAQGGDPLATGKERERSFEISSQPRDLVFPAAAELGVTVQELEYNRQPVRRFQKKIPGEGGNPVGMVEILLSAERIESSRAAIRDRMLAVSLVASGVAAALSFCLAAFLTYPIRTLVKDLRQVSLGNFDHQSNVRAGDEIGDLAQTFNHMTANLRQAQEAVVAQKALEHELNLATRIQKRLLPSTIPSLPGFDLAVHYHPAREVGGDYYDFLRIDDEQLGVVVADVSGKGVPGSLVMTMTRSLLRLAAAHQNSPAETIRQVNRVLASDLSPGMFVTLVYLVLHVPTRRVRLVRAGHNAPLLFVSRLGRIIPLQPKGIALGLDPRGNLFHQELEVQQFTFQSGDFLALYTDGIVEGKDAAGECYSDERFTRRLRESAGSGAAQIIDGVLDDLSSHRQAAEQSDDITLLVLKSTL